MHHRGDGALEQMPLLCEAFSSPQAELVMMPLLCSQNRGYNCPFLLSFPPQTCPELLLLSSAVSLWKILHPACSRCSINDNIPHTHQNHNSMHGSLYCQVLLSSPLLPHCQSSCGSYCHNLHVGSWQGTYPTFLKNNAAAPSCSSPSLGCVSVDSMMHLCPP